MQCMHNINLYVQLESNGIVQAIQSLRCFETHNTEFSVMHIDSTVSTSKYSILMKYAYIRAWIHCRLRCDRSVFYTRKPADSSFLHLYDIDAPMYICIVDNYNVFVAFCASRPQHIFLLLMLTPGHWFIFLCWLVFGPIVNV